MTIVPDLGAVLAMAGPAGELVKAFAPVLAEPALLLALAALMRTMRSRR